VANSIGKPLLKLFTPNKNSLRRKKKDFPVDQFTFVYKNRKTVMTQKRVSLVSLLILSGSWLTPLISQNNMTLHFVNGTEQYTSLSGLSKISFSDNNMVMTFTNGRFEAIELLSVQSIGFYNNVDGVEVQESSDAMMIYPCPATDRVTLANIPEGAKKAVLYRLDGSMVYCIQLSSTSQDIDVRSIPSGFYVLRVNNSIVKFVKK
jgi:hypothetical protein